LLGRRRHSSILDIRSFRVADCDTDHYLVLANVTERLAVSKETARRFYMEKKNLKKLNDIEGKEQYRVEISNRFVVLENLDTGVDVNKACETIRQNIKISAKESIRYYILKKHKPWFDEGYTKFIRLKETSQICISLNPNEIIGDNMNNIRRETSRQFRNKKE
jgi:hypothetical protein